MSTDKRPCVHILQIRDRFLTDIPSWLGFDSVGYWIERKPLESEVSAEDLAKFVDINDTVDDEKLLDYFSEKGRYEDRVLVTEEWHSEAVFLTDVQAEDFADKFSYRYNFHRVVPCFARGELKKKIE